jgi:hypothetical protein
MGDVGFRISDVGFRISVALGSGFLVIEGWPFKFEIPMDFVHL